MNTTVSTGVRPSFQWVEGGRQGLEDRYLWALLTNDPNAEVLGRRLTRSANNVLFLCSSCPQLETNTQEAKSAAVA